MTTDSRRTGCIDELDSCHLVVATCWTHNYLDQVAQIRSLDILDPLLGDLYPTTGPFLLLRRQQLQPLPLMTGSHQRLKAVILKHSSHLLSAVHP